jgi:hypothetical protein
MELCGAVSQQREHCSLPAGHVELGHMLHTASDPDGIYTHRWYADNAVSLIPA